MHTNQRTSLFARLLAAIAATVLAVGCRDVVSPTTPRSTSANFATSTPSGEIKGTGSIGTGTATPGSSRQDFDFDITSDLNGHLTFTDWSVVRSSTSVGQITVSPTDLGTWFSAFRDGSSACANPANGVEVDGTGRLDTGVLISFTLYACDNGPSGSNTDFLRFYMASANYDRNGNLTSGDVAKSGSVAATSPNAQIAGVGSIGPGTQTVGSDRQDFNFTVTGAPGGTMHYTDWKYALTADSGQYVIVDPTKDPATGITSYQQTSATCVRFGGIGRVNGISTYAFYVDACDNANPGTGFDTFSLTVPDLDGQGNTYRESGTVSSGDISLSGNTVPTTGTLNVTTSTTGSNIPSGYTVSVDGSSGVSIAANGSQAFTNLSSGSHNVVLSGVAANCTVSGGTTQTANVPAGGSASVSFQVTCSATTGTLNVTTATTGSNIPSGYTLSVDGSSGVSIGANASQAFPNVSSGNHTVVLSGVAANCTVSGGTSKTANVPGGGSVTVAFQVSCVATTGTLNVTTATTGANLDPDGYSLSVDGSSAVPIADNASQAFTNVTAGSHTVVLSGVAANCTVSGGTSKSANVPGGGSVTVAFQVSCVAPPATHLAFNVQPGNTTAGHSISPAVQVSALDASGNIVTSYSGTVTIALGSNPTGTTLSGSTTASVVNGVATFSNLSLTKAGTGYTLTASASGLTGATSSSFSISAGTAASMVFTVQPSNTQTATAISPAVKVTAYDAYGNAATNFNGSMTMAIGQNPSYGTLSGTTTVTAANGVGTFSNLQINRAGNGYTLQVSAPGVASAGSAQFNVAQKPIICILGICL